MVDCNGRVDAIAQSDGAIVARILRAENIRSLRARYPSDYMKLVGDAPYTFRPVRENYTPVEVIKACHCLSYQSCEADDYDQTHAKRLLDQIERAAISHVPGYESAEWGWTRKHQADQFVNIMDLILRRA